MVWWDFQFHFVTSGSVLVSRKGGARWAVVIQIVTGHGSYLSAWLWKVSLSTGLAILHTQSSHLPGRVSISCNQALFFSYRTGSHCLRVLIESLFISGCVRVTDLYRIAEISSENSLKCSNMRELENEVCLSDHEAKHVCEINLSTRNSLISLPFSLS